MRELLSFLGKDDAGEIRVDNGFIVVKGRIDDLFPLLPIFEIDTVKAIKVFFRQYHVLNPALILQGRIVRLVQIPEACL